MGRVLVCLIALLVAAAMLAAAPAAAWQPEAPRYGVGKQSNVPVTMSDGTVLRANVYYPTDPATGAAAKGTFPVVMVQTPYGKDTVGAGSGAEGGAEAGTQAGPLPYLITRGYIDVVAEVRGTGDSHGSFDLLNPMQGRDGAELVRWAAKLPHANGNVGLYGPSYMGLDQYMTANAIGPHSPLKALFPIVAGNDTYRDAAFDGGIVDGEFDLAVIFTIFGGLELVNPAAENPTDFADFLAVEGEHTPALQSYNANQASNIATGGDQAYDEDYWQIRAPRNMLARVVRNGIPAYLIDGWFDLYQRGAPLDYSGLQNAYFARPVSAPMKPGQRVTGRYQLLQGPWYHLDAGTGVDIYRLELAWFNRWLKGERTGIDQTTRPLHVNALGPGRWLDTSHYPFREASPHTYYFAGGPSSSGAPSQNDGRLTTAPPTGAQGADQVLFTAATSPCNAGTEQWGAGAGQFALESGQLPPDRCTQDDRSIQAGPGALTYTTDPMPNDRVIAGPIDATVYATSTRPETELVATVEDVAPDGTSRPLTAGALLGSFRKLDTALSWYGADARPMLPYHPYTRASASPVPIGQASRFDVEVNPILAQIAAGHRVRLTLTTSDTPHLLPIPQQAANLAGGVYQVQRNSAGASFVELPLASPSDFGRCAGNEGIYRFEKTVDRATLDCSPGRSACLNSRGGARGRRLGPARLGLTRKRQRRALRGKRLRSRRGMDRYCASGGGSFRIGYLRRRVALVLTSSRRFSVNGIGPGASVRALRRRLRGERRLRVGRNVWYLARGRGSTLLYEARGRRVRDVGIGERRRTGSRGSARRFLRSWDLRRP